MCLLLRIKILFKRCPYKVYRGTWFNILLCKDQRIILFFNIVILIFYKTDLQTKLEISKHKSDQQARALVEKERDAVRRVQAAREEEFVKLTKVESEK